MAWAIRLTVRTVRIVHPGIGTRAARPSVGATTRRGRASRSGRTSLTGRPGRSAARTRPAACTRAASSCSACRAPSGCSASPGPSSTGERGRAQDERRYQYNGKKSCPRHRDFSITSKQRTTPKDVPKCRAIAGSIDTGNLYSRRQRSAKSAIASSRAWAQRVP